MLFTRFLCVGAFEINWMSTAVTCNLQLPEIRLKGQCGSPGIRTHNLVQHFLLCKLFGQDVCVSL